MIQNQHGSKLTRYSLINSKYMLTDVPCGCYLEYSKAQIQNFTFNATVLLINTCDLFIYPSYQKSPSLFNDVYDTHRMFPLHFFLLSKTPFSSNIQFHFVLPMINNLVPYSVFNCELLTIISMYARSTLTVLMLIMPAK